MLDARKMEGERKNERAGRGRERKSSSPPLPALLLAPLFARSLIFVPRSLFQNQAPHCGKKEKKIGVGEKKKKKQTKKKNGERSGPRSSLGRGISFFSILALTICTEISVKNFRQMVLVFFLAPKTGTGLSCTTYKIPVNFSLSLDLKPGTGDPDKWYRKFRSFR